MEELLLQISLMLVEVFFEALLELGGEVFSDVLSRLAVDVFKPAEPPHPVLSGLIWGFLGAAAGATSLAILPHPIFHRSKFHGISLIVSPFAAGMAMSALGTMLRRRGKEVVQIESFPYAFAFALGMALVRLAWAS
ncbi:MAG: hypothetical protein ACLPHP_04910 [Candidatus Sulfotelmatobacter sp.]